MAKEKTFDTILTKAVRIFKTDMCVLHNKYCLGGSESEKESVGTFLLSLKENYMDVVKSTFSTEDMIYVTNMREAKKDLHSNINLKVIPKVAEDNEEKLKTFLHYIQLSTQWTPLELTEEEIDKIFTGGELYTLFKEDDHIPSLQIGKSLFPGITKKNISTIQYHLFTPSDEEELYKILIAYEGAVSKVYELIDFINFKK